MAVNHIWKKYKTDKLYQKAYKTVYSRKKMDRNTWVKNKGYYCENYSFNENSGKFQGINSSYYNEYELTDGLDKANLVIYSIQNEEKEVKKFSAYMKMEHLSGAVTQGFYYVTEERIYAELLSEKKSTYIGEVKATERNAYPDNNYQGDYWYEYVGIDNQAPTISGEDTDLGEKNRPFEISYEAKDADTADNVTITEYLNNSVIRTISNANNTNQTLKITQELLNSCPLGETNTIKIYAEDSKGAGTYRKYYFRRTNTPPYFVEKNTDLGTISKAPTVQFTIKDDDGDNNLNVKVKLNQKVVKAYSRVASGTQLSYTMDWKDFMQLDHSIQHNLWVELEDSSGAISILKHTFQRDTKKIEIEVNTDVLKNKIKLVVFNANAELGEGATLEQWACIDYEGAKTWEKIVNGIPYTFKTSQGSNAKLGYRCVLKKGSTKSVVKSIGGSFI